MQTTDKGYQTPNRVEETDKHIVVIEERKGDRDDITQKFPKDVYERTTQAVGNQQWVANAWAEGQLPTHEFAGNFCAVRTSTENFRGKQYPDGHGVLKHYKTIEAYRTLNQLVLINSQCYARGWAKCNAPHKGYCEQRFTLPLTAMKRGYKQERPELKHISTVEVGDEEDPNGYDRLVVYEVEGNETYYRAAREKFDDDPLADSEVGKFLQAINGN